MHDSTMKVTETKVYGIAHPACLAQPEEQQL